MKPIMKPNEWRLPLEVELSLRKQEDQCKKDHGILQRKGKQIATALIQRATVTKFN